MTIREVIANIKRLEVTENFQEDIIVAFEDFSVEGETEVVISRDNNNPQVTYQAYVNHSQSPIVCIKMNEEETKILDVWEA